MIEFRQILRALLEERSISVHEFAQATGFTDEAIELWLDGTRYPTMSTIKRFAKYLGVPVNYLTGRIYIAGLTPAECERLSHVHIDFKKGHSIHTMSPSDIRKLIGMIDEAWASRYSESNDSIDDI